MANTTIERLRAGGCEIGLFRTAEAAEDAPLVLLLCGQESGEAVFAAALEAGARRFFLAAIPVEDWDGSLSPWRAPQPFRGGEFSGGADAFLRRLEGELLPAIRAALPAPASPCYPAGYSLAGLFSVYALYRSAAFAGAVSASGSLWFPGFAEFAAAREPLRPPRRVYFSLGDRESRTKNPVFRRTEETTSALSAALREKGAESVFERNPGGHFQDPEKRMARGIAWITA